MSDKQWTTDEIAADIASSSRYKAPEQIDVQTRLARRAVELKAEVAELRNFIAWTAGQLSGVAPDSVNSDELMAMARTTVIGDRARVKELGVLDGQLRGRVVVAELGLKRANTHASNLEEANTALQTDRGELKLLRDFLCQEFGRPAYAELEDGEWPATHAIEVMNSQREELSRATTRADELEATLSKSSEAWDGPETDSFVEGVRREAAHQITRWGAAHDESKSPEDTYWVVGYLAGKALAALRQGDLEKFKHHAITTSAVLLNWHARISNTSTKQSKESGS